ncbi:hypothetical protein [Planococcus sp. ISL-110]|uniref:hypothetical protein n=1 Tax=Planococcus sp. ISL-110 TaxID=2819167 RepID=UPI001BE647A3|nr:hypothetical protein [Planococcus sp. ISL-110]MBT2571105.1 hypothetical protein [Planococcus sp. ISL-110]
MWPTIATLLVLLILGLSINKIIVKTKKTPITDPKSLVTSICFLLIGVINLAGYWFGFLGIASMALTVALLITGAYFTRYLPADNTRQS